LLLYSGEDANSIRAAMERSVSEQVESALAERLNDRIAPLDARDRLVAFRAAIPGRIVFTTSFGLEDQVITRMIADAGLDIEIATLDTGRLFPEL
jgi:phosphoadenosine phosphosulfate reductase